MIDLTQRRLEKQLAEMEIQHQEASLLLMNVPTSKTAEIWEQLQDIDQKLNKLRAQIADLTEQ